MRKQQTDTSKLAKRVMDPRAPLRFGDDPHNPWSGKDRPAFNWYVYRQYCEGKVDKDGNII